MQRRTLIAAGAGLAAATVVYFLPEAGVSKVVSDARNAEGLAPKPGRLLVDIREPSEWKESGVLEGARLHSWRSPQDFAAAFGDQLSQADEILVICRSGSRSSRAARALSDYLDREVVDVSGGMLRIAREGQARLVAPTAAMGCAAC
jgi:rhodanese-related sulfurtransferase